MYQFPFRRPNLHMFKALWDWNLDKIVKIKLKFNNVVDLPCKLMPSAAFCLTSSCPSKFIFDTVNPFLLD